MAFIREYGYDLLNGIHCKTVVFDTVEEAESLSEFAKTVSEFADDDILSILDGGIGVVQLGDNIEEREYSVFILSRK